MSALSRSVAFDCVRLRGGLPPQRGGGFFGGAPNGPLVLPGTYLVKLEVGDDLAEQEVVVRLDPRAETDMVALEARQEAARSASTLSGTITDPNVSPEKMSLAIKGAKALSALAVGPVGLLAPFVSLGAHQKHPCDIRSITQIGLEAPGNE